MARSDLAEVSARGVDREPENFGSKGRIEAKKSGGLQLDRAFARLGERGVGGPRSRSQVGRRLARDLGVARQRPHHPPIEMALQVRNQFETDAVAVVLETAVRGALPGRDAAALEVSEHLAPRGLEQGSHEEPLPYGLDRRKPADAASANEAQKHGFGLVVERVAERNAVGAHIRRDAPKELVTRV